MVLLFEVAVWMLLLKGADVAVQILFAGSLVPSIRARLSLEFFAVWMDL